MWESHGWARWAARVYAAANEAGGSPVLLDPNFDNAPGGDIVIGIYDAETRTFTPSDDEMLANAVLVDAKRREGSPNGPLGLAWGGLFGIDSAEFSRWAIAVAEGGPHNADIIALNPTDKQSFYMFGNGYLDVGEGVVQVNSGSGAGTTFQGTSLTFIAGAVDMVANDYLTRGNPQLDDVALNTEQDYVSDPYTGLPEPIPGDPMFPPKISGQRVARFGVPRGSVCGDLRCLVCRLASARRYHLRARRGERTMILRIVGEWRLVPCQPPLR